MVRGSMRSHLSEIPVRMDAVHFLHLEGPHYEPPALAGPATNTLQKHPFPVSQPAEMRKLRMLERNSQGIPGDMTVEEGDERRTLREAIMRLYTVLVTAMN